MNHRMSNNAQWQAAIFKKAGLLPRSSRADQDDDHRLVGTELLLPSLQGEWPRKDHPRRSSFQGQLGLAV